MHRASLGGLEPLVDIQSVDYDDQILCQRVWLKLSDGFLEIHYFESFLGDID